MRRRSTCMAGKSVKAFGKITESVRLRSKSFLNGLGVWEWYVEVCCFGNKIPNEEYEG